jgi:hypothetical protein
MKKKIEVSQSDFSIEEVEKAIQEKAETTKEYLFKRTYIGLLGAFYRGEKYELTEEQYNKLKKDIQ